MVEDDASDSDDDQESSGYDSNSGDNNIELRFSYSESADENTDPATTEPLLSDDSVCEVLDGLSSLFGEREESSKDESNDEDDNIELRLSDAESADDNAEPLATEPVMSDDSVGSLIWATMMTRSRNIAISLMTRSRQWIC